MEKRFSWGSPISRVVLTAALDVLAERGYAALTVEELQVRAGVAGLLIQQSDLDHIVITALQEVRLFAVPPSTGTLRGDLRSLLSIWRSTQGPDERVLAAVMSAAEFNPRLKDAVIETFDRPLGQAVSAVVSRAAARSEVPGHRSPTLSWILRGLALHRLRADHPRCPVDLDELLDFLLGGLGAASTR